MLTTKYHRVDRTRSGSEPDRISEVVDELAVRCATADGAVPVAAQPSDRVIG